MRLGSSEGVVTVWVEDVAETAECGAERVDAREEGRDDDSAEVLADHFGIVAELAD